jgi:hypothetical protein
MQPACFWFIQFEVTTHHTKRDLIKFSERVHAMAACTQNNEPRLRHHKVDIATELEPDDKITVHVDVS